MRPQLLHRTILRNRIGTGISVLSAIVGLASHKESIMRIALIAAAGEGLQSMHRGCSCSGWPLRYWKDCWRR